MTPGLDKCEAPKRGLEQPGLLKLAVPVFGLVTQTRLPECWEDEARTADGDKGATLINAKVAMSVLQCVMSEPCFSNV